MQNIYVGRETEYNSLKHYRTKGAKGKKPSHIGIDSKGNYIYKDTQKVSNEYKQELAANSKKNVYPEPKKNMYTPSKQTIVNVKTGEKRTIDNPAVKKPLPQPKSPSVSSSSQSKQGLIKGGKTVGSAFVMSPSGAATAVQVTGYKHSKLYDKTQSVLKKVGKTKISDIIKKK